MKVKVGVTGGAGFIGSHLVGALQEKGFEVVVADIKTGTDVRDTEKITKLFSGTTYIFHLAALPRVPYSLEYPQETNDTNVTGTLSVLCAARAVGVKRVIFSSSSSVYGDADQMPLAEVMPAQPKSPYALQKYVGELYCKLFSDVYNVPTVSLRYFNVYGPGADPHGAYALVIAKFLQMRAQGEALTITGDGTQTRDFTHVRDVVQANILAATSTKVGNGEVINVGAGRNASVLEIAKLIGGPTTQVPARLEPHDTLADAAKARELLGWVPHVSLEDGIAELKKIEGLV
jgi:UDP-glucose 4-epimerase